MKNVPIKLDSEWFHEAQHKKDEMKYLDVNSKEEKRGSGRHLLCVKIETKMRRPFNDGFSFNAASVSVRMKMIMLSLKLNHDSTTTVPYPKNPYRVPSKFVNVTCTFSCQKHVQV